MTVLLLNETSPPPVVLENAHLVFGYFGPSLDIALLYISFHSFVSSIGCEIDKAILDPL